MYNKAKNTIYFFILILFFSSVTFYYFSEENKKKIYKNRENLSENIKKRIAKIPVLKSDTESIIEYNPSNLENEKIKKRYFWELLRKD